MVATDTATSTYTDAVGRSLRAAWVNHGFHPILRAAELPSVPFHGLRHSAATAAIASAVWSADRTDIDAMVGRAPVDPARVKPASGCPAPNRTAADSLVDWRAPGGLSSVPRTPGPSTYWYRSGELSCRGKCNQMPYRREAEIVLAVWREVERGLLAPDLIADDREHLESEAARLRDEYQRLIAEAKLHARPVPPELPVYLIEPQESSRRAQTSGLGGSGLGPSLLLTLASPPHEGT